MKIVFCWSNISGYMASCWRELAGRPGVELHVVAYGDSQESDFGCDLMDGVSWTSLEEAKRSDAGFISRSVADLEPDVVVLAGWLNPAYVALTALPNFSKVHFMMGMDTPWRNTLRQRMARVALGKYLSRLSAVFVPGERAWQFARRLGIPGECIHRGMYGVDWDGLGDAFRVRRAGAWPRRFLFAGRYHEQKGVDILVDAYRHYRRQVDAPWDLDLCGMGPLESRLTGIEGLTDHGFMQPEQARMLMSKAGALVLPSRYDPWPLIILEAAASGLPLVASEACGSIVEVLRPHYNGLTVSAEPTAPELAAAMVRLSHQSDLATWGDRSRALAEPYSAKFWAERWLAVAVDVVLNPSSHPNT